MASQLGGSEFQVHHSHSPWDCQTDCQGSLAGAAVRPGSPRSRSCRGFLGLNRRKKRAVADRWRSTIPSRSPEKVQLDKVTARTFPTSADLEKKGRRSVTNPPGSQVHLEGSWHIRAVRNEHRSGVRLRRLSKVFGPCHRCSRLAPDTSPMQCQDRIKQRVDP